MGSTLVSSEHRDGRRRSTQPGVQGRRMTQPFARPHDLGRRIGTIGPWRPSGGQRLEGLGLRRGRTIGDDHDRCAGRRCRPERVECALQILGPVGGEQDDRRQPGRWLFETGWHATTRSVADALAVGLVGGGRRRQRKVRAPVGDPPAGRLDLGAQPVRLRPVARGAGLRPGMRRRQDVVRDALAGHPGRIARNASGTTWPISSGFRSPGRTRSEYIAARCSGRTVRARSSATRPSAAVIWPAASQGPR